MHNCGYPKVVAKSGFLGFSPAALWRTPGRRCPLAVEAAGPVPVDWSFLPGGLRRFGRGSGTGRIGIELPRRVTGPPPGQGPRSASPACSAVNAPPGKATLTKGGDVFHRLGLVRISVLLGGWTLIQPATAHP